MGQLRAIVAKDFAECFEQGKRHWESCVRFQGAYFEGNRAVIVLCAMFLVSFIFFSKCLCFSYCMAGYLLDRPGKVKCRIGGNSPMKLTNITTLSFDKCRKLWLRLFCFNHVDNCPNSTLSLFNNKLKIVSYTCLYCALKLNI